VSANAEYVLAPAMLATFLQGVAVGIALAAPIGPVGALCIRHALTRGARAALATGLGAALADAALAAVAAFGLTAIASALQDHAAAMRLGGGALLVGVGGRMLRAGSTIAGGGLPPSAGIAALTSSVALTLANPLTVGAFMAAFAVVGTPANAADATALTLGVFAGSSLWWAALALGAVRLRRKLGPNLLDAIARVAAVAMIGLGLAALAWGVQALLA
jgi:putative LysE/RhtB family amino acid efflux pump